MKKICLTLLLLALCSLFCASLAFAETTVIAGVSITIETDKTIYDYDEDIIVTLAIENNNAGTLDNMLVTPVFPSDLRVRSGYNLNPRSVGSVASGDSYSDTIIVYLPRPTPTGAGNATIPQTGDSHFIFYFAVVALFASVLVGLCLARKRKHKLWKTLGTIFVLAILLTGLVGFPVAYADVVAESTTVTTQATVAGILRTFSFDVAFDVATSGIALQVYIGNRSSVLSGATIQVQYGSSTDWVLNPDGSRLTAITDASGQALILLPPGSYKLVMFYQSMNRGNMPISVSYGVIAPTEWFVPPIAD